MEGDELCGGPNDERPDRGRGTEVWQRLSAYAYLSAPERLEYVAVMRVFCGTLLADLAVPDVLAKLAQTGDPGDPGGPGAALDAETLTTRLEQLVRWGNLLRSTHTVRAASIVEYQRSRSRYQLSKLGERVQRDADEVLAGADAAREVSSELLTLVDRGLHEIAAMVGAPGGADPQQALERISTLFVQFAEFAESVRDFYAYLGQVLARYDLDGSEYQGFKDLLLDYVEAITEDISFRAPRIATHLDAIWPYLPALLARIDAHAAGIGALADGLPETRVQRSRGRDLTDWEGLRDWFTDTGGHEHGSQVDQLRDATLRALQSLLANAKRMLRSASGEMSRRKDLLRLAAWFDEAEPEEAHDMAVAAFGLYGARHLGVAPDPDRSVPAYVSWWTGPVVDVPVALRERGSRAPRGRAASVEDHSEQKRRLMEQARQQAEARQAAADELLSASGRFDQVRLGAPAMRLLLELLTTALGNAQLRKDASRDFLLDGAQSSDEDLGVRLTAWRTFGRHAVLRSVDGDLTVDDLTLTIERLASERLTSERLAESLAVESLDVGGPAVRGASMPGSGEARA
ncbi:TIGR02677 family protein [Streptomyces sp. DSM 40750]|uniref:TIGR02677 family protein n=1 Tax=Streptomyces sp. DSM 40750 TaxID=2801030 RepID=UPI00214ACCCA|nr:TIGR02677 family protein [Streptomyces sp. DSM 40750]UUU21580.1 TIGR02677 family protein [Streptomyces sp. DSM 40750]